MIKYLYGRVEYLAPFINGKKGLRFSDLSHYARLENELMRDDELTKKFKLVQDCARFLLNGIEIDAKAIVGGVEIALDVANSYCLCLSSRQDSEELYEKFKADVCLAIDIEKLVDFVGCMKESFPGIQIEHGDVTYFDPYEPMPISDCQRVSVL